MPMFDHKYRQSLGHKSEYEENPFIQETYPLIVCLQFAEFIGNGQLYRKLHYIHAYRNLLYSFHIHLSNLSIIKCR